MVTKKIFLILLLSAAPATFYIASLFSQHFARTQVCPWKRGDNRCNTSQDCCEGEQCTSFNYCELAQ